MVSVSCCCTSFWQRRKVKGDKKCITQPGDDAGSVKTLHVEVKKSSGTNNSRPTSPAVPVPFQFVGSSRSQVNIMNQDHNPLAAKEARHGKTPALKGNNSDCRFLVDDIDDCDNINNKMCNTDTEEGVEMILSEQASDPGGWKAEHWASPELKRSCSDLAMKSKYWELNGQLPSLISKSHDKKKRLADMRILVGDAMSPVSVRTHCSADMVILKKHSSSRILPSGSWKLWWKLFIWSHRNLPRTRSAKLPLAKVKPSTLHQEGGYSSDFAEPRQAVDSNKLRSHSLLVSDSMGLDKDDTDNHSWDGYCGGLGAWQQNQWVAFPVNLSPLERVSEWIAESSKHPPYQSVDDDNNGGGGLLSPLSPKNSTSQVKDLFHSTQQPEEVLHADNVVRSLNANSAVAHITGIGLKVIPWISHFTSLRAVHLSGNFIAHIAPGSLPKCLHILNLSKNNISTIEGLRELTRLRVLDLSYNRISSIGQGLSNCTLIKELCLAGNKISNVEGLHRLLKLAVLDLSFNRITTAKGLGQVVANYSTLIAVNLLGNPIQSSMNDDQLRKMVCSLLPKLALLNRQPINPQKAREIRAKSALGNNTSWNVQRKAMRKTAGNVGSSTSSPRATRRSSHAGSSAANIKHRPKTQSSHEIMH